MLPVVVVGVVAMVDVQAPIKGRTSVLESRRRRQTGHWQNDGSHHRWQQSHNQCLTIKGRPAHQMLREAARGGSLYSHHAVAPRHHGSAGRRLAYQQPRSRRWDRSSFRRNKSRRHYQCPRREGYIRYMTCIDRRVCTLRTACCCTQTVVVHAGSMTPDLT